eukprot:CAMPEP_0171050494 /NCGR_PEP_ID=MMETSP0736-20130129/52435_1 /TAXON_ID=186038 /ORGANISM="Fragilariopsis kerguelensis, Strain L26-C5" /LENGTH=464 /DNA_ID=CAMNT_0011503279 /DNA_START=159 /DNA_END=1549 /DNA_ORIENTATION=+
MHYVGIIHRDVKPSNVVKRGSKNLFCMVDFGLSKSIVVPSDSALADSKLIWKGAAWMGESLGSARSCYRKERERADFRGTSMYASVRVHQLKDYCPRDDIWSLLYVFCDLASGGLPWMSHAANRDREACKIIKERIHGLEAQADGDTRRLLMGDKYHVALFKKRKGNVDPPDHDQDALVDDDNDPSLPRPLALFDDEHKIGLLTKAFEHLKGLEYSDRPDYELIRKCLQGFLTTTSEDNHSSNMSNNNPMDDQNSPIPPIDWELLAEDFKTNDSKSMIGENNAEEEIGAPLFGEAADMARLPLELRFRVAQMDYNTLHSITIESHLALRDWLNVALPLLHCPWDSKQYEKGGHRSNDDGYRREFFFKLVDKCLECAIKFRNFREMKIIYDDDITIDPIPSSCSDEVKQEGHNKRRRRVQINNMDELESYGEKSNNKGLLDLVLISKVMFELRMTKKAEEKLSRA